MSKVSFSRELLGVVRFVFDKTKSRTLNATQAYDKSPSQIVLASYPATASKKLLAKNSMPFNAGGVASVRFDQVGAAAAAANEGLVKSDIVSKQLESELAGGTTVIGISFIARIGSEEAKDYVEPGTTTFNFNGTGLVGCDVGDDRAVRSKKTKELYYGAITVGTGDYRAWQGKYAVLKVDLLTDKAILRVYNE